MGGPSETSNSTSKPAVAVVSRLPGAQRMPRPANLRTALMALALGITASACGFVPEDEAVNDAPCELAEGELAISEFMADPAGSDAGREWIELYNPTARTVSLKKAEIVVHSGTKHELHRVAKPVTVEPLSYVVLGSGEPSDGVVNYSYGNDLALPNAGGRIVVQCNGMVVDTLSYGAHATGASAVTDTADTTNTADNAHTTGDGATTDSASPEAPLEPLPKPNSGYSLSMDGSVPPDSLLNDDGYRWCDAAASFSENREDAGTPGRKNDVCGLFACLGANGTGRTTQAPATAGSVLISEVFANPAGPDAGREWIEIANASAQEVDLNGLMLQQTTHEGGERNWQLRSRACITVAAGAYAVLAVAPGGDGAATRLAADAVLVGESLYNGAGTLTLKLGDLVLDRAEVPKALDGKAHNLDVARLEAGVGMASADHFCPARTLFGDASDAERGSPGAANHTCGAVCIDGDGREIAWVAPGPGDVWLSEIYADPDGADGRRDWVELTVAKNLTNGEGFVHLNGLALTNYRPGSSSQRILAVQGASSADDDEKEGSDVAVSPCLAASAGARVVLAGVGAAADGVRSEGTLVGASSTMLYNDAATVELRQGDQLLHTVDYPKPASGRSYMLSDIDTDPMWCTSIDPDGQADTGFLGIGTPGEANGSCAL